MKDWPHSPAHRLSEAGTYMVTASTYKKVPVFNSPARLDFLVERLFALAEKYQWQLQAWAVFPNHYHFVAVSPEKAQSLRSLIQQFHAKTAIASNREKGTPGQAVWFEYWDTRLTFEKSYLARLAYVHHNAVHHGLVRVAANYPWCSAGWFQRKASRAFFATVTQFPCDKVKVPDDFAVAGHGLQLDHPPKSAL